MPFTNIFVSAVSGSVLLWHGVGGPCSWYNLGNTLAEMGPECEADAIAA